MACERDPIVDEAFCDLMRTFEQKMWVVNSGLRVAEKSGAVLQLASACLRNRHILGEADEIAKLFHESPHAAEVVKDLRTMMNRLIGDIMNLRHDGEDVYVYAIMRQLEILGITDPAWTAVLYPEKSDNNS